MAELNMELDRLMKGEPEALANPFEVWKRLREEAPVHRIGNRVLLTRYADCKALCQDVSDRYGYTFGQSALARKLIASWPEDAARAFEDIWTFLALTLPMRSGQDHARLRGVAHRAFTPRRVALLERGLRRDVAELVEPLAERGTVDVMELGWTVPLNAASDLLDCPRDDAQAIHVWSRAITTCAHHPEPATMLEGQRALGEFRAYVGERVAASRRKSTHTDLVAQLLDASDGERLCDDELVAMFVTILAVGHETTTNLIGHGLHELLVHRDQWERLCATPSLWDDAIDELLRFVSPAQYTHRAASRPHRLAGVDVAEGDVVYPVLAAANRDPSVFDDPDTLDVTRPNARSHLAFGFGGKYCLGSALARQQAAIVLGELARRFPGLRLAAIQLQYTGTPQHRRLVELPVTDKRPRRSGAAVAS